MKHGGTFFESLTSFFGVHSQRISIPAQCIRSFQQEETAFFTVRGMLTMIYSLCRLLLVTLSDWYHLPLQTIINNSLNYGSVSFGQKLFQSEQFIHCFMFFSFLLLISPENDSNSNYTVKNREHCIKQSNRKKRGKT